MVTPILPLSAFPRTRCLAQAWICLHPSAGPLSSAFLCSVQRGRGKMEPTVAGHQHRRKRRKATESVLDSSSFWFFFLCVWCVCVVCWCILRTNVAKFFHEYRGLVFAALFHSHGECRSPLKTKNANQDGELLACNVRHLKHHGNKTAAMLRSFGEVHVGVWFCLHLELYRLSTRFCRGSGPAALCPWRALT